MSTAAAERDCPRPLSRRPGSSILLGLALLASAACEDTPQALPEPVSFTGEMVSHASVEHGLTVSEDGLVALTVEDLEFRDLATGELTPLAPALRFGLGRPDTDPDDDDTDFNELPDFCDETFFGGVLEGSSQVFRLEARDYCVSLTDAAMTSVIPEGKVAVYTLSFTSAE